MYCINTKCCVCNIPCIACLARQGWNNRSNSNTRQQHSNKSSSSLRIRSAIFSSLSRSSSEASGKAWAVYNLTHAMHVQRTSCDIFDLFVPPLLFDTISSHTVLYYIDIQHSSLGLQHHWQFQIPTEGMLKML